MNKLVLLVSLSLGSMLALAQGLDSEAERVRIRAARAQQEAHYQSEEVACYARFAVTDCLHEVRALRRAALADLRRQERLLNDLERQRQAQEKLDQIRTREAPV